MNKFKQNIASLMFFAPLWFVQEKIFNWNLTDWQTWLIYIPCAVILWNILLWLVKDDTK